MDKTLPPTVKLDFCVCIAPCETTCDSSSGYKDLQDVVRVNFGHKNQTELTCVGVL